VDWKLLGELGAMRAVALGDFSVWLAGFSGALALWLLDCGLESVLRPLWALTLVTSPILFKIAL
jgi:hypothetical protein